jgi:hypothetical protein
MRGRLIALVGLLGALTLVPSTALAQRSSGVRGTVLDTTCSAGCGVECPPPPSCREGFACPQAAAAAIACPLQPQARAIVCVQAPCEPAEYPPYEGTAATVLVRRAGSAKVLMRVPVNEGRFEALVGPGRYVVRARVGLPCWTGTRQVVTVEPGRFTSTTLRVNDGCVVHPDGAAERFMPSAIMP